MKLAIIDYNRGQVPSTINEALSISPYSRKDIEEYLEGSKGVYRVNKAFGLCEYKYKEINQERENS